MDTQATPKDPVRILLETRPALDKHAGIPQQTRLLFRGLALIPDLSIEGLLQSSTHALSKGLPLDGRTWLRPLPTHEKIDRLARVVIMLEQKFLRSHMSVASVALRRLVGASEKLTRFDPTQFRDFIWRRLFSRTLPPADFQVVMQRPFRIARTPWTAMHISALIYRALGFRVFPRLDTQGIDVMIAETPYPATVSKNTQLVIRYHDAIPLLMPHTIADRRHHQAFHYRALRQNVESGAWFVCVSESTRKDLLSIFPQAEARSTTIHNMVSHDYFDEASSASRTREIIRTRGNQRITVRNRSSHAAIFEGSDAKESLRYLLMVSTIEPRKNHLALLSAWERLRAESQQRLRLILVGSLGWHHGSIVRKLRPWIERGDVFMLEDVPSSELRLLYKHARATICPSLAEGFDLSGVEAMKSGGAVVASDIPVHREIYSDAAEYFDPYSAEDLVRAITAVIDPTRAQQRDEFVRRGATIAARFDCEVIMPKWHAFLAARVPTPLRTPGR
jgi:glycosyltransferase involved in cell wall biosynthesis